MKVNGMNWTAVINGKRALNGERYSAQFEGKVAHCEPEASIYDVVRELADHLEVNNEDMEFPDSLKITLHPVQ